MGDIGPPCDFNASRRASLPSAKPTASFWQTSHPNELVNHRSTPELPEQAEVIVIGSGITSAFVVQELLESTTSATVLVLEARTTCSGATGRNGGHLQPLVHEQLPHIIDFELSTFDLVESTIETNSIPCDFRRVPGCIGFWNRTYFEEAKEALAKARDIDPSHAQLVEIIEDPEELRRLRLIGAVGALRQCVAATLSPYKLVIGLFQKMLDKHPHRLNLQTDTPVSSIESSNHSSDTTLVHTSRGTIRCRQVVIATNGYASHLLPEFEGVITPTQGQMAASSPHGTYSHQLLPHSYGFLGVGDQDRIMSDYLVQAPLDTGGHLMFGGARACVPNGGVGVSDDSYVDLDAEAYLRRLPERLDLRSPASAAADSESSGKLDMISSWTGIMGYSRDHFPWIGAVPDRDRVWIAAGCKFAPVPPISQDLLISVDTGHGMTNAPGCGRYLARLVVANMNGKDWREDGHELSSRRNIPKEDVVSKSRLADAKVKL